MHKNRNEVGWTELKGKAKRQWDKFHERPVDSLSVNQNNLDEDVYNVQKIKKDRANMLDLDLQDLLEVMPNDDFKNVKPFLRK